MVNVLVSARGNNKEQKTNLPIEVYACWSLDKLDRKSSSSGGIASIFYKKILKENRYLFWL